MQSCWIFLFLIYFFYILSCKDNISVLFLNELFGQCTDSDGCAVDRATAWCEMTDTVYYRSVDCISVYTENLVGCDRLCLLSFADWVPSYPRRCCWMRWATRSWWTWCGRRRCTCMKRGKAFNAWQSCYWTTETTQEIWCKALTETATSDWIKVRMLVGMLCSTVGLTGHSFTSGGGQWSSDDWPTSLLCHASVKTENSCQTIASTVFVTNVTDATLGCWHDQTTLSYSCFSSCFCTDQTCGWRSWGTMTALYGPNFVTSSFYAYMCFYC